LLAPHLKDKVAIWFITDGTIGITVSITMEEEMIYQDIYWGTESKGVSKNLKDTVSSFAITILRRVIVYSRKQ
jgi:hypothetical protein